MTNTANKEALVLSDPAIFPDEGVLKAILGADYPFYQEFITSAAGLGLQLEWKYYRDSKSWLCRWTKGSKTIFWLSVWTDGLRVSFFFSEKARDGVFGLPIDEAIKKELAAAPLKWRLYALPMRIGRDNAGDALKIAEYKKTR